MISENIDRIKILSIMITGFLFSFCVILFYHIYYIQDKYGWIYNSTTIINNDIVISTVYLKDQFIFLGILFMFSIFSFIILILSQLIEREIRIE